jgi:prepilin-type N-terminal cleavage/methylation domain-containing protein/prepilin-type processing-associated H-X9-DG protein
MNCRPKAKKPSKDIPTAKGAFTLVELLTVVAIIGVLAAILLPALSRARERSRGVFCLNNTRQLALAWRLYADDHDNALPYNLCMNSSSVRTNSNWVNNVMTWDLSSDNTNLNTITGAGLGVYVAGLTGIFHCPSDQALSAVQQAAGWTQRIRSYSMNAMVGNAGAYSVNGYNLNNPNYRQFFKMDQIPLPTEIFVFLDEHPNSIDDGSFLDTDSSSSGYYGMSSVGVSEWVDLPASYHNRSASFSFADGHADAHRWQKSSTVVAAAPNVAYAPIQISSLAGADTDFEWLLAHMSVGN